MFLSQRGDPPRGHILDPPNAFSDRFVEGRGDHHAFDQSAGQFEALLGRQLERHLCKICRNHAESLPGSSPNARELTQIWIRPAATPAVGRSGPAHGLIQNATENRSNGNHGFDSHTRFGAAGPRVSAARRRPCERAQVPLPPPDGDPLLRAFHAEHAAAEVSPL